MAALLAPPRRAPAAEIAPVPPAVRARMEGVSWHGGDPRCPRWADLAYLQVDHVSFDGPARGELVVAAALATRAVALFRRLWQIGFPIRQLRLVDDFGAFDDASMAADNSSAFNFRVVAGTDLLSQHALGLAIDLNPVENPYVWSGGVSPWNGAPYADRTNHRRGMIDHGDPVWWAFRNRSWEWGGDWTSSVQDYQHFSLNGR